jgi:hypothetical protein
VAGDLNALVLGLSKQRLGELGIASPSSFSLVAHSRKFIVETDRGFVNAASSQG